jgi:hypothetical protein
MGDPTNLQEVLESTVASAFDRLLELQAQNVKPTNSIHYPLWCEGEKPSVLGYIDNKLVPNMTKYFPDGWERFTGNTTNEMLPIFELYVSGHNAVYRYNLGSELIDGLKALHQTDTD